MIVVDLETTGLLKPDTKDPEQQPGIVQIGMAKIMPINGAISNGFAILNTASWLIDPEKPVWDEDSIKVHGITKEDVAGKPTLFAVLPELCNWFLGEDTWVGFNTEFDRKVLFYALARLSREGYFPWPSKDWDVMKIAKPVLNIAGKRDIKHPSLVECHLELTGVNYANAHDALADVRATVECLSKLAEQGYVW